MTQDTATGRIAAACARRRGRPLEADVRDRLKRHLLDWVGVAVGGYAHAESTPAVVDAVDTVAGDGDEATAVGSGARRSAEAAALHNGALAHSLDFDDTHRESSLHPAAPVVAAALAAAERADADGETLLSALAAGYDVTCGVGRAVGPDSHYDRGFHVTATCGTFGATAAAGVVAGLDADRLTAAFGVNGSQAAGSLQFLENGAWNKRLHPGLAARRAVLAVALGEAGFVGAEAPLCGDHGFLRGYSDDPDPAALDDVSATGESVLETGLKPYPCCRYMHPALDALTDLSEEVSADAVDSVVVDLPKPGVTLTGDPIDGKRRPANFVDCQFSMPFAAALALREGDAGLASFLGAQDELDDPGLRRLMDAVSVTSTDAVMADFPSLWPARVVVEAGGERFERRVDAARGEPENPMEWAEVEAKFRELASTAGVPDREADRLLDVVETIEDRPASDLGDAIAAAAGE
jgi:2-methylcitrate dehydratase PrpD